MKRDKTRL